MQNVNCMLLEESNAGGRGRVVADAHFSPSQLVSGHPGAEHVIAGNMIGACCLNGGARPSSAAECGLIKPNKGCWHLLGPETLLDLRRPAHKHPHHRPHGIEVNKGNSEHI